LIADTVRLPAFSSPSSQIAAVIDAIDALLRDACDGVTAPDHDAHRMTALGESRTRCR
jgi:hypothetical protein